MNVTWRPYVLGSLLPLTALVLWCLAALNDWSNSPVFASPADVLRSAWELATDGELGGAILASLGRYFSGLLFGATAGLVIGLLLGLSPLSRRLFGPTLRTVQQISLFAWVPLIMAWFGLAETSKVVFIALAAFFPVLVNTFEGVGSVPHTLVEVARVHRFSHMQMLRHVVLPAALPSIFTGLYLALIYGWLATLGAEYLMTSGSGLGSLLVDAQEQYQMDRMLLEIVLVSAIGFGLSALAGRLEKHWLRWRSVA
ncbi:MAG: ABC transporter permease [Pseudomonas sp.]|uniref:ABC transporter permease n=1 Tax=Pseudomonas sp. TaxID=306 RepID=UPI0030F325DF